MDADGNCLFRSLSDQLYYDFGNNHGEVRSDVCDFMEEHKSDFQHFLVIDEEDDADVDAPDFESYVRNMRESGDWGGNLELVAAARLYRRNIIVYSTGHALTIAHGQEKAGGTDMMVSYHENDHYNSVRDKSAAKPPKTSKIKTWSIIESSDSLETEAVFEQDENDDDEVTKQKETVVEPTVPNVKPAKKNDPCPCASGVKYKKCCWTTDKSKERARKWKQKHGLAEESDDDAEADNIEIDGGFKVLKI
jgi:OTU domain-containing protein 3